MKKEKKNRTNIDANEKIGKLNAQTVTLIVSIFKYRTHSRIYTKRELAHPNDYILFFLSSYIREPRVLWPI